ncbi:MAG: tetratricopeptide repeat protein [Deltaproteobacteria bacterium]|nr:tetratricopeptide repeat protein [Deltaproteobacteria bacterium]
MEGGNSELGGERGGKPPREPGKVGWRFPSFALFAFPLLAILAWSNSFSVPMLLDDAWNLVKNPGMERLWPPWWPNTGSVGTGLAGRPVTAFTFAVNHAISGTSVWSYHAVNLLIHVLSGLVLFGLLGRIFPAPGRSTADKYTFSENEARWLAFFCALTWLAHPLTTQAVTYITQRLESLAALFYLATLYGAARSVEPGASEKSSHWWGAVSVAAFILGVGSKETLVTAPFAVILYEWTVTGKGPSRILSRSPRRYLGYLVGLGLLAALVLSGQTAGHAYGGNAAFSGLDHFLFQPRVIWHYIRLAIFPFGLCFDYGQHGISTGNLFDSALPVKLFFAAALAAPFFAGAFFTLKRRAAGLAASLFFLLLAPTSSILPLFLVAEEHRAYLPLAAILALTMTAAYLFLKHAGASGKTCAALGAAIAVVLGSATFHRNADYASEEAIWTATLSVAPKSARAWAALAKIAEGRGETEKAISLYRKAINLYPDFAVARINLGSILTKKGRLQEAVDQFAKVVESPSPVIKKTERAMALSNLGNVFMASGRPERAVEFFEKAVMMEPDWATALSNLGAALAASGRPVDALRPLMRALELDPGRIESRLNLARALYSLGRTEDAEKFLVQARALAPESPAVKNFVLPDSNGKAP